jgi:hypothetical protein
VPSLGEGESKILKAQIYDLNEKACKQALFAMVQILEEHPSILLTPFRLIIEDAGKYTREVNRGSFSIHPVSDTPMR